MFKGVIPALVTPFRSENVLEIDWKSYENLVEWQLSTGVDGFVLYGSTGEAATLKASEKLELLKRTKDIVKGKIPLIVGAGTNDTESSIEFINEVKSLSPDAVLAVAPYYNKPSQEGIFRHYEAIANRGGLPLILYNVPSRTVIDVSIETYVRLASVPNVVAIKQSTDSVSNLTELCSRVGDQVAVLAGDDPVVLYTMLVGGKGVISASASVMPEEFVSLYKACEKNDWNAAAKIQKEILPKIQSLFIESNPCPAKAVLMKKGIISSDAVRLPLVPVSEASREKLNKLF